MASGRSIRFKITTLLVVPLVSLVALWGFAASTTTGPAVELLSMSTFSDGVLGPADELVYQLQRERLASAERLGGSANGVIQQRAVTDKARRDFLDQVRSDDIQAALTATMKTQLNGVYAHLDRLTELRHGLDNGVVTPARLVRDYAVITDAIYGFYGYFPPTLTADTYRISLGVIDADRSRELLQRQHTLIVATGGELGDDERDQLTRLDGAREQLMARAREELDGDMRAKYDAIISSKDYIGLSGAIAAFATDREPTVESWRRQANPVLESLHKATVSATVLLVGRVEPLGFSILLRAGTAGVLGLIAVIFSVFYSVRVGRALGDELAGLRGSAIELAEVRLPRVV